VRIESNAIVAMGFSCLGLIAGCGDDDGDGNANTGGTGATGGSGASGGTGAAGGSGATGGTGAAGGTGGSDGGAGGAGGAAMCITDPAGPAGTASPFAGLAFDQVAPFVQMSTVWGDRATGPHGTVGLFNAGADSGPHTHSGTYWGVVIQGTMTNPFGTEANAPEMGPGSFWRVPAGEQHSTLCISAEPCLFYFHAEEAFDFTPINMVTDPPSAEALALPADQVVFTEAAPFVEFGPAWGDMSMGAHGTFGLFPGEASSPSHIHSDEYYGIVISGTLTNPFAGEASPPQLEAGSAWSVPGDSDHVTACVSTEPCLFYFHARDAFDFTPVCE